MPIDYQTARGLLETEFPKAERWLLQGSSPTVPEQFKATCSILFASKTQAFREALLGCLVARLQDKDINIRQPYVRQGPNAFSGRSLDEKVINPFLQDKRIPSSRGPYLSVFRRSVEFSKPTREGIRDQDAYDTFLKALAHIESISEDSAFITLLNYLLLEFAKLRERSEIEIVHIQRLSLEQFGSLVTSLLGIPSGGRFPLLLSVATFQAINETFDLDWNINWQGINVADAASGAGGDITVTKAGITIVAAEVTERPIDRARVLTTFNNKIAPSAIGDYLFFVRLPGVSEDAKQLARHYFAQGHEINFLEIKDWILMVLAAIGKNGRQAFNQCLVTLLDDPDIPSGLKVAWNEQVSNIASQG